MCRGSHAGREASHADLLWKVNDGENLSDGHAPRESSELMLSPRAVKELYKPQGFETSQDRGMFEIQDRGLEGGAKRLHMLAKQYAAQTVFGQDSLIHLVKLTITVW